MAWVLWLHGGGDVIGSPHTYRRFGADVSAATGPRALEAKARAAGVDATLREHPDLHHVWPVFTPDTTEGAEAVTTLADFWKRHLATGSAA